MVPGEKNRLDRALLERGLARDLKEAQALVMAGEVWVNGRREDKPGLPVAADATIEVRCPRPYVSRGALKIEKAVAEFAIVPAGLNVLDLGISTGGFSDYFLQHGAAAVLGVDVTIAQVDSRLRANPRLRLLEKNARFLEMSDVPFAPDLVVMDLSFISIAAVLPVLRIFPQARVLALVKPQFEAARQRVGRGGVVRDPETRRSVLLRLKSRIEELDYGLTAWCRAGVKGRRGNQEYFFLLRQGKKYSIDDTIIRDAVEM
ncbi:MAG: TlyA family RNA methyltransferase [Acidobacteria bacterium]|jgi:23S rRNA (cytidine1920-2'-O)/16S rRNA (cytidine1409-2'-O)-methyltransferase|nr:TlyA family RNA methyltransferase [Acidobacteriota bacterium]